MEWYRKAEEWQEGEWGDYCNCPGKPGGPDSRKSKHNETH